MYAKLKATVMNTNAIIEINDLLKELKGYGDNYQSIMKSNLESLKKELYQ